MERCTHACTRDTLTHAHLACSWLAGKNIADFVDPDIEAKLEELEREEEERAQLAAMEAADEEEDEEVTAAQALSALTGFLGIGKGGVEGFFGTCYSGKSSAMR